MEFEFNPDLAAFLQLAGMSLVCCGLFGVVVEIARYAIRRTFS